jgi:endo-1,4-beta-xylanase
MVEEINEIWRKHAEYDNRLLIEGIGMQAHCNHNTDLSNVRASIERFIKTGAKLSVTELDVTFGSNDAPAKPLNADQSKRQAEIYAGLFGMYTEFSEHIERVTMWARHDGHSWRSWGSPVLFDCKYNPKEAYHAVIGTAEQ